MQPDNSDSQRVCSHNRAVEDHLPSVVNADWFAELNKQDRLNTLTRLLCPTEISVNFVPLPYFGFIFCLLCVSISFIERKVSYALVGIFIAVFWSVYVYKMEQLKRSSQQAIERGSQILKALEDRRTLNVLVGALSTSTSDVKPEIEAALLRLLPRVQSEEADLLDLSARQHLYRILLGNQNHRQDYHLAIIKMAEVIQDVEAIPTLKKITSRNLRSASVNIPIYLAAEACLKKLEARWAEVKDEKTLMRASSNNAEEAANLLRAASGVPEVRADSLLRPSQSESSPDPEAES
jgi:hypothetical protein